MSELVGARAIATALSRLAGIAVSAKQVYRLAEQERGPIRADRERWTVRAEAAALEQWWTTAHFPRTFGKRLMNMALGRERAPMPKGKHIVRAAAGQVGELRVVGPIGTGELTTQAFLDAVTKLGAVDTIRVVINSDGGLVNDGLAIYHTLRMQKAKVEVEIVGVAASMASAIAMAGAKISMAEDGLFMFHDPWSVVGGNSAELRTAADMLDKYGESMAGIYARRTKYTEAQILEMMGEDRGAGTWLNAPQALAAGFIDAILAPAEARLPVIPAAALAKRITKGNKGAPTVKKFAAQLVALIAAMVKGDVKREDIIDDLAVQSELTIDKVNEIIEGKAFPTLAQLRAFADALGSSTKELRPLAEADGHKFDAKKPAATAQLPAVAQVSDVGREVREALAADRTRALTIQAVGRQHGLPDDAIATIVAASADVAAGNGAILAWLSDPKNKPRINAANGNLSGGEDERTKFVAGATQALDVRAGLAKRENGNQFYGLTLTGLAAKALAMAGISVAGLTQDGIARKVLASQTTSDFPQLLSSTAGKVLRAAYGAFPATWASWALKGSVSDFKIAPRVQMGSFNNLALIPEGGEYTAGSLSEDYENAQAATKGKLLRLTRQMVVNDDLGGFQRRAQLMGSAAARTVNADAYAYLTSGASNHGPTTTDGGQYFNATAQAAGTSGHGNLTSSGTAITTASIAVGRNIMRTRRDKGFRETLNILPKVLLAPVGKEDIAWAVLNSITDVSQSNPAKKNYAFDVAKLDLVTDPYLDTISATAWYMFAAPADAAAGFEVVFLDGEETPFIDEMVDFMTDAMDFKIRLDYGVATGDWRGGYKNVGA